jgi:hypothetical protein
MKKLIILTLVCFALAGLGNVFSRSLSSLISPSDELPASGWAMFKEDHPTLRARLANVHPSPQDGAEPGRRTR